MSRSLLGDEAIVDHGIDDALAKLLPGNNRKSIPATSTQPTSHSTSIAMVRLRGMWPHDETGNNDRQTRDASFHSESKVQVRRKGWHTRG